jgi:hypothetical protein
MNFCRAAAVIAILAAHGTFGAAVAQQKKPQQQVNPNDPSIYRPPPKPPARPHVAPAPGPATPMERIPPVAPPVQPATR